VQTFLRSTARPDTLLAVLSKRHYTVLWHNSEGLAPHLETEDGGMEIDRSRPRPCGGLVRGALAVALLVMVLVPVVRVTPAEAEAWSLPVAVDSGHALMSVTCPSTAQCTAVDESGRAVTFNPASPGSPTPTTIDSGGNLESVACSSTAQCTAVDESGQMVTFDPTAPGTPTPIVIDSGRALTSVTCPSTAQCTAVDASGRELTFDPGSPGSPVPVTIDSGIGLNSLAVRLRASAVQLMKPSRR
jgi:hypothetical protein